MTKRGNNVRKDEAWQLALLRGVVLTLLAALALRFGPASGILASLPILLGLLGVWQLLLGGLRIARAYQRHFR